MRKGRSRDFGLRGGISDALMCQENKDGGETNGRILTWRFWTSDEVNRKRKKKKIPNWRGRRQWLCRDGASGGIGATGSDFDCLGGWGTRELGGEEVHSIRKGRVGGFFSVEGGTNVGKRQDAPRNKQRLYLQGGVDR